MDFSISRTARDHLFSPRRWNTGKLAFALLFVANPVSSIASSHAVGFKELKLGMTERSVPKTRKLSCKPSDSFLSNFSGRISSKLELEKRRLEALSYFGDRYCRISAADTVGGMPVVEMRLLFLRGELGKIEISFSETGISKPTGRGYGEWSSDNLAVLVSSLATRYGRHTLVSKLVCPRKRYCRDAPMGNTFTWTPTGATVTLTYVESTVGTSPTLTFLSDKFTAETDVLRTHAKRISDQIDQEERSTNEKKLRARSADL